MLQLLRSKAQGWILGFIILILIISFALWGVQSYLNPQPGQQTVAKVNGKTISREAYNLLYQNLRQQYISQKGSEFLTQNVQKKLRHQALQTLINEEVLATNAFKMDMRVSPQTLDATIQMIPAFQVDGKFSQEKLLEYFHFQNNQANFFKRLQNQIVINQLQYGIEESGFALPYEVNTVIQLINQTRDIAYFLIPASKFLNQVKVTDAEIVSYYQQNQQKYQNPERVSIEYIKLSPEDVKKSITIDEKTLKQYYENNKASFSKPFEAVKNEIKQTLVNDKLQERFASESDALTNLTYTNPGSLVPAAEGLTLKIESTPLFSRKGEKSGLIANRQIVDAAFSANVLQQGNNSDPITLKDNSVLVLRVLKHKKISFKSLAEVTSDIHNQLKEKKAMSKAKKLARTIEEKLNTEISPEKLANEYQLKWEKKANIKRNDSTLDPQIIASAFNLTISNNKKKAATIAKLDKEIAIIQVSNIKPGEASSTKERISSEKNLSELNGDFMYQLYVKDLIKRAKIKVP